MERETFNINVILNGKVSSLALADGGSSAYGLIEDSYAHQHNLQRISITPREMESFENECDYAITEVAVASMKIGTHEEKHAFFYVVPKLMGVDIILGLPWFIKNDVILDTRRGVCHIRASNTKVKSSRL